VLFNSNLYLIFLAAVAGLYFILPFKWRSSLLLAASFAFYMKWSVSLVAIIIYIILLNYAAAIVISRQKRESVRKAILAGAVIGNLSPLFTFKYLDFALRSTGWILNADSWPALNLVVPIGISFYTFKALSYTIDVYRRKMEADYSLLETALYIIFFPQLLSGPIMRAPDLIAEFRKATRPDLDRFTQGALIIAGGLVKKVVIADTIARYVNEVFAAPGEFSGATLLAASYGFTLQIYLDFSGYTDIANGTCRLLGINPMENFNKPYLSRSFQEFWRRWHISLSSWLRDYLYISLGGNRKGRYRTYLNILITMLLGGLWHGANYTFVVWGGLHGLALAVERWVNDLRGRSEAHGLVGVWVRRLLVFHVVSLLWVFFRADNISDAYALISGVITWEAGKALGWWPVYLLLGYMAYEVLGQYRSLPSLLMRRPMLVRWIVYAVLAFMVVIFSEARSQEFIYFKF